MEARDDVDVEKMKEEYCLSNNLHCARYMVAMAVGEDRVPADLYPHEKDKAYTLIAELG
jgi:methyl-accepting chemotaxis protein